MIPKIIHYIWLGSEPIPTEMLECMNSWKMYMPDYELKCWNDDSIIEIDCDFVKEALQERKFAFASDVIRLYAVYKYGGIYMDTDVVVYKSFTPLLVNHAFIGRENSMHQIAHTMEVYLTTCCFGAEKENAFIKRCLDYYVGRHFITSPDRSLPSCLRLNLTINSFIFAVLAKEIGFNSSVLADTVQQCKEDVLTIYPQRYFDSTIITSDTYTKHLALGTWRGESPKVYIYNWKYKIEWRVRAIVSKILRMCNYVMLKLE